MLEGEIKKAASKAEEGKLSVKYTIPLTPETKYSVLETDYDTYAVLWSCSGIGPFHTQNAWVMTRERLAPGTVLQKVRIFINILTVMTSTREWYSSFQRDLSSIISSQFLDKLRLLVLGRRMLNLFF